MLVVLPCMLGKEPEASKRGKGKGGDAGAHPSLVSTVGPFAKAVAARPSTIVRLRVVVVQIIMWVALRRLFDARTRVETMIIEWPAKRREQNCQKAWVKRGSISGVLCGGFSGHFLVKWEFRLPAFSIS